MASHLHLHLHLHLLLILLCSSYLFHVEIAGAQKKNFNVGVILDNSTWVGNISWSCMAMAMEDFYAAHENYTTRLVLHPRDVNQDDTIEAASAAVDLLKNVKVQAIIGPQSSTQAKFLIDLGDKTQVPIISFSAKSPSLSSIQSPFFFQTSCNDSVQAKAIADIVQAFGWRQVVPIFEDTNYGSGIIPYLADSLQEIDVRVPYRSSIPLQATRDEIQAELLKLKNMQTRVFVVHMSYGLGYQLFLHAQEKGMMEDGYVWVITYGLADIVTLLGSSAARVMQGTLGIRPYVNLTSRLQDFKLRWKKKYVLRNWDQKAIEPTAFGLWAYDTVWMMATVAEAVGDMNLSLSPGNGSTDLSRLGSSPNGMELHDKIANTTFAGISGKFSLVNGQLDTSAFEIINVVGDGERRIGFWTASLGIFHYTDGKPNHTLDVVWPGKLRKTPKGWEWPRIGEKLRIGVPVEPSFIEFINVNRSPITHRRGYCLEVFDAVMKELPYKVSYDYFPYSDARGEMNGTYDNLVYEVYLKNYDAVVGDVTILANRSLYVDFTLPFTESGVSIVVPIKDKQRKNALTFLDPLTPDLWLASGAFFIIAGFFIWILEHGTNDNSASVQPCNRMDNAFYFSFSMLVFSHGKIANNLTKIIVIVYIFVIFILQNSYMASLTSILTKQELEPIVSDLNDLIRSGYSLGYLNGSFLPGLLKSFNFNESKLVVLNSEEEYNEALSNGSVAAIIDEIPYIKVFLSKYCSKYVMTGPVYKTGGFGFVFPKGSPLVPDVSRAILTVTENNDTMDELEKILGGNGCPIQGVDSLATSSSRLSIRSFWGLFLITGVASLLALLFFLGHFLYQHREIFRENSIKNGLILLAEKFSKEDSSCRDSRKHEDVNQLRTDDNSVTSRTESDAPSRTSISTHGHETPRSDVLTDDEGTTRRESGSRLQDLPSFSDMLNER